MGRQVSATDFAGLISPEQLVFLPGSSGAPLEFMQALQSAPECSRDLRLLTSYVPGINALDIDSFHSTAQVSGLFMQPSLSQAQRDGRYRHLPFSCAGFTRYLVDAIDIDLLVVQVSPPDSQGRCSLGPAVEFLPTALGKSRRILALINQRTPRVAGSPSVDFARFDYFCEVDSPLPGYMPRTDSIAKTIARHVACLVPNGSTLQLGLGRIPAALYQALANHRGLRLHSGMISDGLLELEAAGALDPDATHSACVLIGGAALYDRAAQWPMLRVAGCETIHDPRTLLGLRNFVAVNSAVEVDLFGQCNLEHAGGHAISGAGGAPDFARGAKLAPEGLSIVALSAYQSRERRSSLVPSLAPGTVSSLSRVDIDYVVTEFGVARLMGASVHERAEALIQVAAPEYREELRLAWRNIASRL